MPSPLFLGLDLGTTNAKAAAYNAHGTLIAVATSHYPTHFSEVHGAEQRMADWTAALSAACRQLLSELGKRKETVVAVALSAHGPGVVLLGANGELLLPSTSIWQDSRCFAQGERLLAAMGSAWTGLGMPRNSFPAKLCWTLEHYPSEAAAAKWALGIKDYLGYWLTGEIATEPTQVAGGKQWSSSLIAACGWSLDRLPQVQPSTAIIGNLRQPVANELGLPTGLPVVAGLADGAAATLSMGAIRPLDAVMTLATSGVIRLVLPQPVDPAIHLAHDLFCWHYVDDLWIAGGHIKSAASALQWLGDLIASPAPADTLDDLLEKAAASPVGSRGVRFLPYLLGRGSPQADEHARAAFLGLTLAHQRGDMTRALLEGVAFAYREVLEDFEQLGYTIPSLRISGGGARSELWRQIIATLLKRPLHYYTADSTLGAAMVAAVGTQTYPDFVAASANMVHVETSTEPDRTQSALYDELFLDYQSLRNRLYG